MIDFEINQQVQWPKKHYFCVSSLLQQNVLKTKSPVKWFSTKHLLKDNESDFADVTLACEDGYQVEAHQSYNCYIFGEWNLPEDVCN